MSITGIRLRGFRGFKDTTIQLKPLTVLLGPNSSGKSSFGHALAAMAHAQRLYASTPQASLTPQGAGRGDWPIDLGGTRDLRTIGSAGPITIGLETPDGFVDLGFGALSFTDELLLSFVNHPTGEQSTSAATPSRATDVSPLVPPSGVVPVDSGIPAPSNSFQLHRVNQLQWRDGERAAQVLLNGLTLLAVTPEIGTPRLLAKSAQDSVQTFLESLTYLGPGRKRPERQYDDEIGTYQAIGYCGEYTAAVLHRRQAEPVTYPEPAPVPSLNASARIDSEWERMDRPLLSALNAWLGHLGLAQAVEPVMQGAPNSNIQLRVTLPGQSPHDITEVGFGISQTVPILAAGLLQAEGSLLIVDLPEAHLHPRPQGLIADFFCSLIKSGRMALVETHSEMFFHRLRLRAAMDPKLANDIEVYFIDEPKNGLCASPRRIELAYEGELHWPEGFLQEGWELETKINIARKLRESS